jgi:regulator of replication initiation timing
MNKTKQNEVKDKSFIIINSISVINSEDSSSKKAEIIAMISGWNANGLYFSKDIIKEVANAIMEKPKLFVRHDPYAPFGRDPLEWAATFESAEYEEIKGIGQIRCVINFTDNPKTAWLFTEIQKDPKNVHLSTHLRGIGEEEGEAEGRKGFVFKMLTSYQSTDFVSYGAAGGIAIKTLNALSENVDLLEAIENDPTILESFKDKNFIKSLNNLKEGQGENPMKIEDIKSILDFKTGCPDIYNALVTEIKNSFNTDVQLTALNTKVTELDKKITELTTANTELTTANTGLKTSVDTVNASNATLKTENDELKNKVDAFEAKEKLENWKKEVDTEITNSNIPAPVLTDHFKATLYGKTKIEDVKKDIEDRLAICNAIAPTGIQVGGAPKGTNTNSNTTKITDDEFVSSMKE